MVPGGGDAPAGLEKQQRTCNALLVSFVGRWGAEWRKGAGKRGGRHGRPLGVGARGRKGAAIRQGRRNR